MDSEHGLKDIPIRVVQRGAIIVNSATVYRDYDDCKLIYVDLRSKCAELSWCINSSGPLQLWLHANGDTLDIDASVPRDKMTIIEFPDLVGWSAFAVQGPRRYTIALAISRGASGQTFGS